MTTQKLRRKSAASVNNSRWAAYVTAGAATALGCAATAEADIHYSGLVNQLFNAPPGGSTHQAFNLAPGASFVPLHVATASGFGASPRSDFVVLISAAFNGFTSGYAYVSRLAVGQNPATHPFINSVGGFFPGYGTLAFRGGYGNDQWLNAGEGFVGFRFNIGDGVQYGWVHLAMNGSPLNSFTLVDFAWGDLAIKF